MRVLNTQLVVYLTATPDLARCRITPATPEAHVFMDVTVKKSASTEGGMVIMQDLLEGTRGTRFQHTVMKGTCNSI